MAGLTTRLQVRALPEEPFGRQLELAERQVRLPFSPRPRRHQPESPNVYGVPMDRRPLPDHPADGPKSPKFELSAYWQSLLDWARTCWPRPDFPLPGSGDPGVSWRIYGTKRDRGRRSDGLEDQTKEFAELDKHNFPPPATLCGRSGEVMGGGAGGTWAARRSRLYAAERTSRGRSAA